MGRIKISEGTSVLGAFSDVAGELLLHQYCNELECWHHNSDKLWAHTGRVPLLQRGKNWNFTWTALLEAGQWQRHTFCFSPVGLFFYSFGRSASCSFWSDLINCTEPSIFSVLVCMLFHVCLLSVLKVLLTRKVTLVLIIQHLKKVEQLCIESELEKSPNYPFFLNCKTARWNSFTWKWTCNLRLLGKLVA